MVRLSRLSELARKSALAHPCQLNDDTPWTVPSRPLSQGRLALVTTAGLHLRGDRAFTPGDASYRVFPTASAAADVVQSHTSIGFDRTAIQRDLNVVLPLDRMRELVNDGTIGSLGPNVYASWARSARRTTQSRPAAPKSATVCAPKASTSCFSRVPDRSARTPWVCSVERSSERPATVGITLVREHTEKVKPPRALWVPYPYGRPLGLPDDPALQLRVIRAALDLFDAQSGPVLAEFATRIESPDDLSLPQATDVQTAHGGANRRGV